MALFGKLPATGDFIARGLPPGLRAPLDRWVSAHLAGHDAEAWPEAGLRLWLGIGGHGLLAVAGPSMDAAGREYPLLAMVFCDDVGRDEAEGWAQLAAVVVARVVAGEMTADEAEAALSTVKKPGGTGLEKGRAWTSAHDGPPDEVLARLFAERGVPRP